MDAKILKDARHAANLTQHEAAVRLAVTQPYLSMLERGKRPVSAAIARRAATHLPLKPIALPYTGQRPEHFEDALGALGYPGFAYLRNGPRLNPAELLLLALDTADLPARAVEGLPWIPLAFPDLDWDWLLREARLRNRQNRLGYIVELSVQASRQMQRSQTLSILSRVLDQLSASRLAVEDTLCNVSMSEAERRWQRVHRPTMAIHWNLLTHLELSHLNHVIL